MTLYLPEDLLRAAKEFDSEIREFVRDTDNKASLKRKGIEFYAKLERLRNEVVGHRSRVGELSGGVPTYVVEGVLNRSAAFVLKEIFGIEQVDKTFVPPIDYTKTPNQQKETSVDNSVPVRTDSFNEIQVDVENEIVTGDVVAVVLRAKVNGRVLSFTGSAKRSRDDKFDAETGLNLAYGRAFQKLSKQLIRQGNGLVTHQANQRASARRKAEAKAEAARQAEIKRQAQERAANARAALAQKRAAASKPKRTTAKRSTTTRKTVKA